MTSHDDRDTRPRQDRRVFLKQLLVTGGALGSGLTLEASAEPQSGEARPDDGTGPEPRGYRETEHVRLYYAKASL